MHDFDSGPMPDEPFLCVNENGDRFMDESMPSTSAVNILRFQDAADPGKYSMIFDSNYQTQVTDWGGRPADEAKLRQYVPGEGGGEGVVESLIDTHYADTLDELADKLGIPAANLIASVERYNELAKSGVDVDFGKDQAYLKPIDTPPFWGPSSLDSHYCHLWWHCRKWKLPSHRQPERAHPWIVRHGLRRRRSLRSRRLEHLLGGHVGRLMHELRTRCGAACHYGRP